MNYLKLKSLKTLTGYILTFLLMLLTACEDKDSQKISIVKSERVQEKHPEISISKTAGEESLSTQVTKDIFKEITEQENRSALYEDTVFPLSKLGRPSTDQQPGIILNQNDAAASILARIDSNKGHKKRPVRVLYFNPSDRQPVTDYQNRIQKIMTELKDFYGKGMEQNGFGYRTFNLEIVKDRLKIHLIQSDKAAKAYDRDSKTSKEVYSLSAKKLKESGIDLEKETAIVFQNLGKGDDRTFYDTSAPYYGAWNTNSHRKGFCYVVDSKFLNWKNLTSNNKQVKFNGEKSMSLSELASGQIGGVCHELGHAFCLNHTHSNSIQNEKFGTALMGYGNWTFKQEMRNEGKGSYLSFVSAVKLLGHPCFSEIKSGGSEVQITDIALNSMNGILEIQGTLFSSPDIYSVIAYCDDLDKPSDYDAGGWVGTVDNMGKFQISINELNPDKSYQVNLQFLFVNGKENTETVLIKTNKSGAPEIDSSVKEKIILKNALKEKLKGNLKKTETILRELSSANKSESVQFLINTIKVMDKETDVNAVDTP
ncbi:MAG: hypothetical protein NE327_03425 [Lentisphaeraceae bacterium]|nr:hypothetical protein [Lentisphaeraceae bacterium]